MRSVPGAAARRYSRGVNARPLGRSIHLALAVPAAASVAPALLFDFRGGMARDTVFIALTAGAALVALVQVVVVVTRWCRMRPPFHDRAVAGSRHETALAGLTGLCLGGYAGVMQEVEVLGLHFSAGASYFVLLPLALIVCCARSPAWRPFVDVTLLMAGMEAGAQTGLMLTKWKELCWWGDITGIDAAYWAGGLLAAAVWGLARRTGVSFEEYVRVRAANENGDGLPPRRA